MAQIEPLDMENDFEDKENLLQHSNVLPRTPCSEKGYEELDVSELSMKLRYSITPTSSPMSKSYTANCRDNKHYDVIDDSKTLPVHYCNDLTKSLNSTFKANDSISSKTIPLQPLSTDLQHPPRRSMDGNPINTTITFSLSDNLSEDDSSLASPLSSTNLTPEATTPTKEIVKDGGSPILRGLKSVFSMFRSSQSPIPSAEVIPAQHTLSPTTEASEIGNQIPQSVLISTPISKSKESSSKRSSPLKDSLTFKDDLEKELLWKDETTIIFKDEKIPIHKLFLHQPVSTYMLPTQNRVVEAGHNESVEYMDVSHDSTILMDATMADIDTGLGTEVKDVIDNIHAESDGEFVDCETTFTKNESQIANPVDISLNENLEVIETEPENHEQTHKCEILETKEVIKSGNCVDHDVIKVFEQSVNEIMAITHDSTIEIIKNIDSSIEMLKSNQTNNQLTANLCDNSNDNKETMLDLVNVSMGISTVANDLTTSKQIDNINPNISNDDAFECLGKTNDIENKELSYIFTATTNNEKDSKVNNDELGITKTTTNKLRESFNNVLDTSFRECEGIDISPDNSKIITDLGTVVDETYEILTTDNNDISNLDINNQKYDSSFEQAIVGKAVLDLTITNNDYSLVHAHNQKSSDIESTKLCATDINKPETVLSDVDRVEEVTENETAYVKSDITCFENNEQSKSLPHKTENKDTDISSPNNSSFHVKDDNKLVIEKESIILPANIPLPLDTEMDQKLVIDNENVVNDSKPKVSVITDLNCIGFQAISIAEALNVNESINQNISEAIKGDFDNKNVNTAVECTNNEIQITECEIVHHVPDIIDEKLNTYDEGDVEIKPNVVVQFTNEDTFDNEKNNETIGSLNIKLYTNETVDNMLDNIKSNNTNEIVKLTDAVNSENVPYIRLDTSIGPNNEVKMEYDEEIITSASSSPYVSVTDMAISSIGQDKDNLEDVANPFETKSKINISPPNSPQLNKGYNFNFDNIQDPFATKTKIRLSPTPESPKLKSYTPSQNKNCKLNEGQKKELNKNKRKSHSEKVKKCFTNTKHSIRTSDSVKNKENEVVKYIEKINDVTMGKEDIEKDIIGVNQDNNTGNIFNETVSFTNHDDFLKKYKNKQNLFDTNKTEDISSPKTDIVVDNLPTTEFNPIDNTEVLDNTKCVDRTLDLELLKHNEDEKNIYNGDQTVDVSLRKGDNLSNEEIREFQDINNTNNEMRRNDFDNKLNVKNDNESAIDFVKTSLTDIIGDSIVNDANEKNNDTCKTDLIKQILIEEACESTDVKEEIVTSFEQKQNEGKNSSVTHDESASEFSIATCLLKKMEVDCTVTEVNTEDEDTIEGPFLEADSFSNCQNVSNDFGNDSNMMQFDPPPKADIDDNIDKGELFIDAEAFEFLLNQNQTNVITNSGKESLFLKFDPLYSKRISSDDIFAAMSKIQKGQSTPIKGTDAQVTKEDFETEAIQASSSKSSTSFEGYNDDPDVSSTSKPMMVVNPAVNPKVSPRKVTPKINRQSLTFTSPAIAVIDRLLCLSGNNSFVDQNTSFPPREHNTDIALTQLRELLAEKEIHVHNLRLESKELKDRLACLETQMKSLETEGEKRLKKVNDLNERLAEKNKINRSMAVVVEEYERTIASLITEMEQEKKRNAEERNILVKERDEQTTHLASMEVSFNDLHSKYEKSKQIILSMKANEDTYKQSIKDFDENFVKMQNNYELLKQHATSKLNHANQELEKFNKAHESEVLKLNAMIKRKEMHITSLEETLTQKTKANEELAAICDELINKVG